MRLLLIVLLATLTGCVDARPADIKATTHRLIFPSGSLCSGTAIAHNKLLTASHCVDAEPYVSISGESVLILSAKEVSNDNVVLTVAYRFKTWARRGPSPKQGDAVQFFGNGEGFDQYYRAGHFSGWRDSYLIYDLMCGKGDSGAGIFNEAGEVIGVVSAVYTGQHIRLCVASQLGVT